MRNNVLFRAGEREQMKTNVLRKPGRFVAPRAIHEEAPVKIGSEMFAGFPNHPFGIIRRVPRVLPVLFPMTLKVSIKK